MLDLGRGAGVDHEVSISNHIDKLLQYTWQNALDINCGGADTNTPYRNGDLNPRIVAMNEFSECIRFGDAPGGTAEWPPNAVTRLSLIEVPQMQRTDARPGEL